MSKPLVFDDMGFNMSTTIEDIETKFSYVPHFYKRKSQIKNPSKIQQERSMFVKNILQAGYVGPKFIPSTFDDK